MFAFLLSTVLVAVGRMVLWVVHLWGKTGPGTGTLTQVVNGGFNRSYYEEFARLAVVFRRRK